MGQTSSHYGGNSSNSSGSTRNTKRNSKYNRSFSIRHPSISKKVSDLKKDGTAVGGNAYERFKNAKNQNQFNNSNKCCTLPLANSEGGGGTMKNFNPDDLQSSDTSEILLRNLDSDGQPSVRPITISEISQNNQNKQIIDNKQQLNNQVASVEATAANNPINTNINPTTNSANINNYNNNNNNNNKSANNSKKDIYMVSEGYHKTDSCYYKTPDGGYHKLPPDSYHKMSEICYNKLPDGSFKRLIDIQNGKVATNGGTLGSDGATNQSGAANQKKIGNQMIRFLKRSKTHTPATAKDTYTNYRKEMQRTKEKERLMLLKQTENCGGSSNSATFTSTNQKNGNDHTNANTHSANHNNNRHTNHSGNRKVVVTMMENGGLPIVATSKSKAPKGHSNSNRDKVIIIK